ncbi:MAG: 6-carboxytetrahydropterin synthase [Anaerolineae bacterium]|nr:6-carboxytetrahydropterin synthase [Anaerolineae bacterium]
MIEHFALPQVLERKTCLFRHAQFTRDHHPTDQPRIARVLDHATNGLHGHIVDIGVKVTADNNVRRGIAIDLSHIKNAVNQDARFQRLTYTLHRGDK